MGMVIVAMTPEQQIMLNHQEGSIDDGECIDLLWGFLEAKYPLLSNVISDLDGESWTDQKIIELLNEVLIDFN